MTTTVETALGPVATTELGPTLMIGEFLAQVEAYLRCGLLSRGCLHLRCDPPRP